MIFKLSCKVSVAFCHTIRDENGLCCTIFCLGGHISPIFSKLFQKLLGVFTAWCKIRRNHVEVLTVTIDTLFDNALLNQEIGGYVYAIIENETATIKTAGQASPELAMSENLHFDIASLSKLVVTTRIMQLVEDEEIDLDTPVQDILESFRIAHITVEDLLLHRSGFNPSVSKKYLESKQLIKTSIMHAYDWQEANYHTMTYSCINFIILGWIIEALDGSLDHSLNEHVLKPLGMHDTTFNPVSTPLIVPSEIHPTRGLICGTVHDETAASLDGISGNAGLFSTIHDLIAFTNGYLQKTILTPETIDIIVDTNQELRSLGWNLHLYEGQPYLFHTGFTGPAIIMDLNRGRALIILTNRTFPSRSNTAFIETRLKIYDAFLGM
nr:serine hydrolase domain-containing protein [Erysipelothrix anatis]